MSDTRLIKFVKRRGRGVYVTYRCPHCGAIVNTTNQYGDFTCDYCDSPLNTNDVKIVEMED